MSMTLKITIPYAKIAEFCKRNHIARLSLFGSALRDDFGPESDVDLLVEFEPNAEIGLMALSRIQRGFGSLLNRKVDLVPAGGLKPKLRDHVISSSSLIYEA